MVSDAGVLSTVQCWLVEPFCIRSTRSPGLSLVAAPALGRHAPMSFSNVMPQSSECSLAAQIILQWHRGTNTSHHG